MSILKSHPSSHETLREKVTAPFHDAKARLEKIEANATRHGIELAALGGLAVAKRNIDRKLEDLKKTHESNRSHATADIAADVVAFVAAVEDLGKKDTSASAKP